VTKPKPASQPINPKLAMRPMIKSIAEAKAKPRASQGLDFLESDLALRIDLFILPFTFSSLFLDIFRSCLVGKSLLYGLFILADKLKQNNSPENISNRIM